MKYLMLGLVVVALLLGGCGIAMAEELPDNEWQASVGIGQLFSIDLKNGQLLDDRGVCYFADVLPPFNVPLLNKEANTKLIFQVRENSTHTDVDDLMCGGAIAIKGINFFSKDLGGVEVSSGIDPALLVNMSYGYRTLFEDEPFAIKNLVELDAMVYLKVAF